MDTAFRCTSKTKPEKNNSLRLTRLDKLNLESTPSLSLSHACTNQQTHTHMLTNAASPLP